MFSNQMIAAILVPVILEQLLNSVMGTADTMMVSNVGSAAISAVSLVDSINVLVIQAFSALAAGGAIICAQYIGQKNKERANESARQVLFIITAISIVPLAFYNSGAALFRAMGNSKVTMWVSLIMNAINIAGTHGKTTTTSMVSEILLAANMDPTISVGGILNSIGGNTRVGGNKYFVAEACEYTNSFLSFNPTMNIILNVKEDHLDFFKDIDDIRHSFKLFTEKLPSDGTLIINTDIDNYEYFYQDTDCEVITFGSDPAKSMYSASDITYDELGRCTYTLLINNEKADTITLGVPGLHNVYNSLAAIAAARKLSVDMEHIKAGLSNFKGTNRRFEKKGTFNGVTVIDDYAHHPDEIRATLSSAAHYPHNRIWVVFQPHTYSRTKLLFNEFADALSHADKVVLAKIYAARETDTLGISSADLCEKIKSLGKECVYIDNFEDIEKYLLKNCINGDLLITMGAGDIYKVGEDLLK